MERGEVRAVEGAALTGAHFRYFDLVMAAFVTILLLSNVIGAGKVATVTCRGSAPGRSAPGILFFPISYVIGDVLTEVYGYARARRCIWAGFARPAVHGLHELGGGGPPAGGGLDRAGGL